MRSRAERSILRLVAAFGLAVGAGYASADPVIVDNHRIYIAARLNGVATEALIDSAAETSVVDTRFAIAAKLQDGDSITIKGSGGTSAARLDGGAQIDVLGLTLRPEAIAVTDLTDISRRLTKRPVKLIIGRELFDFVRLRINLDLRPYPDHPWNYTFSKALGASDRRALHHCSLFVRLRPALPNRQSR